MYNNKTALSHTDYFLWISHGFMVILPVLKFGLAVRTVCFLVLNPTDWLMDKKFGVKGVACLYS
jgi:hypothetical protein